MSGTVTGTDCWVVPGLVSGAVSGIVTAGDCGADCGAVPGVVPDFEPESIGPLRPSPGVTPPDIE